MSIIEAVWQPDLVDDGASATGATTAANVKAPTTNALVEQELEDQEAK